MRPDFPHREIKHHAPAGTPRPYYISMQGIPVENRLASEALAKEVDDFLKSGGKITVIPPGVSSKTIKLNKKQKRYFTKPEECEEE